MQTFPEDGCLLACDLPLLSVCWAIVEPEFFSRTTTDIKPIQMMNKLNERVASIVVEVARKVNMAEAVKEPFVPAMSVSDGDKGLKATSSAEVASELSFPSNIMLEG